MCHQEGWTYIIGNASHDRWVMISPDEETLLIGEWESTKHRVKKTIRVEKSHLFEHGIPKKIQ